MSDHCEIVSNPPSEIDESHRHTPETVGNTFVQQYYQLLCSDTGRLHRFYKDESQWSHGTGSDFEPVYAGQQAINEQLMSRGYIGSQVDLDIGSIDCQSTSDRSVLVMATGTMRLASSDEYKIFVHTFVLAEQTVGYYVLNDMLRFIEIDTNELENSEESVASDTYPEKDVRRVKDMEESGKPMVSVTVSEPNVSAQPVESDVTLMDAKAKVPVVSKDRTVEEVNPDEKVMETESVPEEVSEKSVEASIVSSSPIPTEETEDKIVENAVADNVKVEKSERHTKKSQAAPKSWAQLFSDRAPSKPAAVAPAPTQKAPATQKAPSSSPKNKVNDQSPTETRKFFSIYIRDFAPATKEQDLRELFSPYGAIANVTIGSERNYAFVDFVEHESVKKVLSEDAPFIHSGKTLYVDERGEKKDNRNYRGDGRGRGRAGRDNKNRSGNKRSVGERSANGVTPNAVPNSAPSTYTPRHDRREKGGRRTGSAGRGNRNE